MFAPLLSASPNWHLLNPSKSAEWYGEIWVKYPLSDSLILSHFGHVFKVKSRFRIIMNEACQTSCSKDSEMTNENAYKFLSQLKGWYGKLPTLLLPCYIVLPGHLQLQYGPYQPTKCSAGQIITTLHSVFSATHSKQD